MKKICSKCNTEKELTEFYNRKESKDGKRSQCISCIRISNKEWRMENKQTVAKYSLKYRASHGAEVIEIARSYYAANRVEIDCKHKQYNIDNPEMIRQISTKRNATRRGWLKPMPLNNFFEGSHLHHLHTIDHTTGEVDHRVAIYIPKELHESIWHSNTNRKTMLEINELAFDFLYTQIHV